MSYCRLTRSGVTTWNSLADAIPQSLYRRPSGHVDGARALAGAEPGQRLARFRHRGYRGAGSRLSTGGVGPRHRAARLSERSAHAVAQRAGGARASAAVSRATPVVATSRTVLLDRLRAAVPRGWSVPAGVGPAAVRAGADRVRGRTAEPDAARGARARPAASGDGGRRNVDRRSRPCCDRRWRR